MEKSKVMNAVKRYAQIQGEIATKIERLDPDLNDNAKRQRTQAIRDGYAQELKTTEQLLDAGKQHFQGIRQSLSDPLAAMFRTALTRAGELTPGHAVVADAFNLLDDATLLAMVPTMGHPGLQLKAWNVLKERGAGIEDAPDRAAHLHKVDTVFQDMAGQHLDRAGIADAAEVMHTVNQVRIEQLQRQGESPQVRMGLAREQQQLEKDMAAYVPGNGQHSPKMQAVLDGLGK